MVGETGCSDSGASEEFGADGRRRQRISGGGVRTCPDSGGCTQPVQLLRGQVHEAPFPRDGRDVVWQAM
jgi:hypothetical protein